MTKENERKEMRVDPKTLICGQKPSELSAKEVEQLITDIKAHGLQEPILVRRRCEKLEIVDGHHRVAAALALGYSVIDVELIGEDEAAYLDSLDREFPSRREGLEEPITLSEVLLAEAKGEVKEPNEDTEPKLPFYTGEGAYKGAFEIRKVNENGKEGYRVFAHSPRMTAGKFVIEPTVKDCFEEEALFPTIEAAQKRTDELIEFEEEASKYGYDDDEDEDETATRATRNPRNPRMTRSENTAGGCLSVKKPRVNVTLLGYEWSAVQQALAESSEYDVMPSMFVFGDLRERVDHREDEKVSQEPFTLKMDPLDLYILQKLIVENICGGEKLLASEREEDEPDTQFIEDLVETHAILTTIMRKFKEQDVVYTLVKQGGQTK